MEQICQKEIGGACLLREKQTGSQDYKPQMSDFGEIQTVSKFVLNTFNPHAFPAVAFNAKQLTHQLQKNHQLFSAFSALRDSLLPRLEDIARLLESDSKKEKSKWQVVDSDEVQRLREDAKSLKEQVGERDRSIAGLQLKVKEFEDRFEHVAAAHPGLQRVQVLFLQEHPRQLAHLRPQAEPAQRQARRPEAGGLPEQLQERGRARRTGGPVQGGGESPAGEERPLSLPAQVPQVDERQIPAAAVTRRLLRHR